VGLTGDYESKPLFVKRTRTTAAHRVGQLPEPLVALEPGVHLGLEFGRSRL